MKKWEYLLKEVTFGEAALDALGAAGWEAVAVDWGFRAATMMILFKRPVSE